MGDIDDNRGKEVTVPLSQSTMPGKEHIDVRNTKEKGGHFAQEPYLANDPVTDRVARKVVCQTISTDIGLTKHENSDRGG